MPNGRRRYRAWIAALAIPAVSTVFVAGAHAATTTGHPGELSAVAGTKPAWARPAAYRGAAIGSTSISLRIWLAGRDRAGLATFVRQVSTPGSKQYRHFLSPVRFRARFGASAAQEKAVTTWARSAGMTVSAVNSHYVTVKTTVAAAGNAFSVRFGEYAENGTLARAPESDALVPAAISSAVLTVTGLDSAAHRERPADTLPPPGPNRWNVGTCSTYFGQATETSLPKAYGASAPWTPCGYTPAQLRSAYGATKSGFTGKGVTVAIVDAYNSPTIVQDINQYSTANSVAGLRAGQYTANLPPSWNTVAGCGGAVWYTEQTLDAEAVHGMAPDANLLYVGAASCNDPDFQDALLRIVDNHLADIVSNSWLGTEDQEASAAAAYDQIFQQGAAEGIGMYFASGDAGYNDPNTAIGANAGSDKMQVNYPASSPWVTAVGGTALAVGATGNYEFETSYGDWRDQLAAGGTSWTHPLPGTYATDLYEAGGGGTSLLYPQPSYQSNVVPASLSQTLPDGTTSGTPMREVPDVAMDADPFTGINIGQTTQQPDGSYAFSRSRYGGTSLATPLFAAVQALAEQAQGSPIGFANPEIYNRFQAGDIKAIKPASTPVDYALTWYTDPFAQTPPVLTYLVTGGVDGQGSSLLALRNGYSAATGVGSPNYAYLASFPPCQAGACR